MSRSSRPPIKPDRLARIPSLPSSQGKCRKSGWQQSSLFDILRAPAEASPYSLEGQLQFILDKWGHLLDEKFVSRIVRGMDFLREEVIRQHGHGDFKPDVPLQTFGGGEYQEYERYSPDKEWMPRLVLLAKNSYVWLEQLSRKYGRWIKTLDQIPDEELDLLRDRGFTGLWLIGLWERSRASQRIKQRMGDADAVASAYSLVFLRYCRRSGRLVCPGEFACACLAARHPPLGRYGSQSHGHRLAMGDRTS